MDAVQLVYTRRCSSCQTMVEQSPSRGGLSKYSETVICMNCGRDCSRRDFPGYYWWWWKHHQRLARKRWWHWRWRLVNIHVPATLDRLERLRRGTDRS